jgi:hypothetical protein
MREVLNRESRRLSGRHGYKSAKSFITTGGRPGIPQARREILEDMDGAFSVKMDAGWEEDRERSGSEEAGVPG